MNRLTGDFKGISMFATVEQALQYNRLRRYRYEDTGLMPDEIAALRAENERYKADIEAGNLVRLPGKLITPYELNDRYWICVWYPERCTLIIQDRVLLNEASSPAQGGEQHG
jgi:hypothetical protein